MVTVAAAVPAWVAIAVSMQAPIATIQTSKAIEVPRAIEAPVTVQTIMAIAVPKVVEATKAPVVVRAAVVIAPVAVEAPVTVGEVAVIMEESHLSALRANLQHSSTKKSLSEKHFTVTAQTPKPSSVVSWGQGQMQFLCYTSSPIPLLSTLSIYHHQIFSQLTKYFKPFHFLSCLPTVEQTCNTSSLPYSCFKIIFSEYGEELSILNFF